MKLLSAKLKPKQVDGAFDRLDDELTSARRKSTRKALIFAAIIALLAILAWVIFDTFVVLVVGIVLLLLSLTPLGFARSRIARRQKKVDFGRSLLNGLRDDILPGSKFRLLFDMRPYDHQSKLSKTRRNPTGKVKKKFSDKWFRVVFRLAEGSVVTVRRQVGIKTKQGSIVTEKRRLFIRLEPSPKRYDLSETAAQASALQKSLKETLRSRAKGELHTGASVDDGAVEVRLVRVGTQITSEDTLEMLKLVIGFLWKYRRKLSA